MWTWVVRRRWVGLWAFALFLGTMGLTPVTVHAAILSCEEGTLPGGALYRICIPEEWNQNLVIYAHGYVAVNRPLALPDGELQLPGGKDVGELLTDLGYAFATTSYRTNGLAIPVALEDLLELNARFSASYPAPARRLLVGASEGGLVTVLAAERYPHVFDGALALCGPYGGFDAQINYFGDFRVLFDYFFPGLMPPTPVDIPPALLDTWETTTYSTTVAPVVFDPANADALAQLLTVSGAAVDAEDPLSRHTTVERLLWYNVYATGDARERLGGQPYENRTRDYRGSADDARLNLEVARFAADPVALASIATTYQTSGALRLPVVTVHTTGDPIVPVWHSQRYRDRVVAAGAADWHEAYVIERYGHCTFTAVELLTLFNRVVERAVTHTRLIYLPALATLD